LELREDPRPEKEFAAKNNNGTKPAAYFLRRNHAGKADIQSCGQENPPWQAEE